MDQKVKNILCVINPVSGNEFPILATLNKAMLDQGSDWDVIITKKDQSLVKQVKQACQNKSYDLIITYGGDDTVHQVAVAVIARDIDIPLYPLHGGTANVLANELQIPQQPQQALDLLIQKQLINQAIDVGKANDKYFINSVLYGSISKVNSQTSRQDKNTLGVLAYIQSLVTHVDELTPHDFSITIKQKIHQMSGIGVLVLNTQISGWGDLKLHSQAGVSSGKLVVAVLPKIGLDTFAKGITELAINQYLDAITHYWIVDGAEITTPNQVPVLCDDYVFKTNSLSVSVNPQSLNMLVPLDESA